MVSRKIINICKNITQKYVNAIVKDFWKYEKLEYKKNKLNRDINFLNNCKQLGVYPTNQCHHMGNARIFASISHSTGKCNKTHDMWESLGNWYSYFSHGNSAFPPLDSHPMVYFIIWEMHGFSHQFPKLWENATKPVVWGNSGKLIFILFP